ncbi:hypothetical protein CYMTET_36608 [Cymbomonas tetramitiformis]|uniref:Uncharacterized protein n=1 Tax=Cymbomonas tetramitiformis TaxID=36881 RepID=A0AAE0CFN3_9CHLO|nr:hypothetical protein CYMTET_36608 [Cymbomonas tetramitiformis]
MMTEEDEETRSMDRENAKRRPISACDKSLLGAELTSGLRELRGARVLPYMDDFLLSASSKGEVFEHKADPRSSTSAALAVSTQTRGTSVPAWRCLRPGCDGGALLRAAQEVRPGGEVEVQPARLDRSRVVETCDGSEPVKRTMDLDVSELGGAASQRFADGVGSVEQAGVEMRSHVTSYNLDLIQRMRTLWLLLTLRGIKAAASYTEV